VSINLTGEKNSNTNRNKSAVEEKVNKKKEKCTQDAYKNAHKTHKDCDSPNQ
jgi:hypothetical protein